MRLVIARCTSEDADVNSDQESLPPSLKRAQEQTHTHLLWHPLAPLERRCELAALERKTEWRSFSGRLFPAFASFLEKFWRKWTSVILWIWDFFLFTHLFQYQSKSFTCWHKHWSGRSRWWPVLRSSFYWWAKHSEHCLSQWRETLTLFAERKKKITMYIVGPYMSKISVDVSGSKWIYSPLHLRRHLKYCWLLQVLVWLLAQPLHRLDWRW